jgi:hypothetical protein
MLRSTHEEGDAVACLGQLSAQRHGFGLEPGHQVGLPRTLDARLVRLGLCLCDLTRALALYGCGHALRQQAL